jgi:metacaspase-1
MNKSAVFVGTNHYLHYPQDELRGCIPDAKNLWMWVAAKMEWPEDDLMILKNSQAANEKAGVLEMVSRPGPARQMIWSHSSHGSNNPDTGQIDGLEELLCCADLRERNGLWDTETCITAAWIGEMVKQVRPQDTLDIILDCCHAPEGGQLKALGLTYNRGRFMRRSITPVAVKPKTVAQTFTLMPPNVALWSACQPEQTSADAYIDNSWQGAATAAFLKSWKPGRTRADMIATARKWLKVNGYAQTPHLYCRQTMALGMI